MGDHVARVIKKEGRRLLPELMSKNLRVLVAVALGVRAVDCDGEGAALVCDDDDRCTTRLIHDKTSAQQELCSTRLTIAVCAHEVDELAVAGSDVAVAVGPGFMVDAEPAILSNKAVAEGSIDCPTLSCARFPAGPLPRRV